MTFLFFFLHPWEPLGILGIKQSVQEQLFLK